MQNVFTYSRFCNNVFHRFKQDKFVYGGSILGARQFSPLPQLPQNLMLNTKKVKKCLKTNHLAMLI
jgi:hypothetical protein